MMIIVMGTWANLKTVKEKAMENGWMKGIIDIKDNGMMIRDMEMEKFSIRMETGILANGIMTRSITSGKSFSKMEPDI